MGRETPTARAKRYREALVGIARLPDGCQSWTKSSIAGYVVDGMTFAEAVKREEEDWAGTVDRDQ